jgi:hypothetical protein
MMKKIIFILCLFIAAPSIAAVVEWDAPVTYTDNTAIPAGKVLTIVYTPFIGDTFTGPWVAGNKTAPGILSATMPDPAPGATKHYTVSATLDGQESGKAVPASKTVPFQTPSPPGCRVR